MKNWTRRLCVILTVCLIVTLLPMTTFAATGKDKQYTDEYGTWSYREEADGSITITGCSNTVKNIVVPATIGGKPVRKLGAHAFKNNDTITAVVIPYLQEFESIEHLKAELNDYMDYYNNRRIKARLKGLPPALHRQQALSVA